MKQKTSAAQLLKNYFELKKKSRPGYSLRTFAKALRVSPAFISHLLSGRKAIPPERLKEIGKILEMDSLAIASLQDAMENEHLQAGGFGIKKTDRNTSATRARINDYTSISKKQFSILSSWYNIAILDLVTCENFQNDNAWIANRLGISSYQAQFAIKQLIDNELIIETATGLQKVPQRVRMALNESHSDVRKFHLQLLDKAKEELLSMTSKEAFDRREISGITLAVNPENFAKAQLHLAEALHEVAEILAEGACTEVYHLSAQLFSLTNNKNTK